MSTSQFLPTLLSDGASVTYPLPDSAVKDSSATTTYRPTILIATIKKYLDHIVRHMQSLENIDVLTNVRRIQEHVVLYSPDLYYGVIKNAEEKSGESYFIDIPANVGERGKGRQVVAKAYSYNPSYYLPEDCMYTYFYDDNICQHANRAAIHLYLLYIAVRDMLFAIKAEQLKKLIQQHKIGDYTRTIDTFSYEFDGKKLPDIPEEFFNEQNYEEIYMTAKQLLVCCEKRTKEITGEPIAKVIAAPPKPIVLAKERIFLAIKNMVDKNPHLTRGIVAFREIIYDKNGSVFSNTKLRNILDAAETAQQRRVLCCFTPGRSDATKKLYAMLNEINNNYYNHDWIMKRVGRIETFLQRYPQKDAAFVGPISELDWPLLAEYKDPFDSNIAMSDEDLKKLIYVRLEDLVRENPNDTRGTMEFFKIINREDGKDPLQKLNEIIESASESAHRKVCCGLFSPPLRSAATQRLYDGLADLQHGFTREKAKQLLLVIDEKLSVFQARRFNN